MRRNSIHRSQTRNGFTVVELMVAMGVIGVLLAITIPAVQSARESARRTQCLSHVKQIGLAFHQFEEVYGHFPGAIVNREYWNVQVLPFLEQEKPIIVNGKTMNPVSSREVMACPSDPESTGQEISQSYLMSNGTNAHFRDGFNSNQSNDPISPRDVTDGLSTTIALSERLVSLGGNAQSYIPLDSPQWHHRLMRRTSVFHEDLDAFAEECETRSHLPRFALHNEEEFTTVQTPNRNSCTNGNRNDIRSGTYAAVTVTSLHPGGVNVGMGDGAARFISDAIDRNVWRALGTRNGNEPIPGDSF
ncbi:putative major pilin subunit [Thalassoglobus neptunius]|uniref:Putative major pilin subunit n=1 Tax=Thalassoglobus neptunius TaxID=1938619 RepID=A0A5C5WJH5_9PLAN|nr:DUF1559 domain-containing protein [Thalassoglobus neptunius]TWT50123.1 putative major pilin subunit [Thalassoglobus neptunius]